MIGKQALREGFRSFDVIWVPEEEGFFCFLFCKMMGLQVEGTEKHVSIVDMHSTG